MLILITRMGVDCMSNNSYTQKSMETIQLAQRLAQERGHQQLEQAHLLAALLNLPEGLIPQLLSKMNVDTEALRQGADAILQKLPQVRGLSREEAQARIQSQMSADEKMKRATDLIDTSGSPEETEKQVSDLLSRFLPRRRVRPVPVVAEPLPGSPAAEPAKAEPAKSAPPSPPKARRRKLSRQARILRLCLIALLVLLGILLTAFGTVRYLEYREERRRIEAEAAERAQHPLYYGDLVLSYSASQGLDPALVAAVILSESSFDPMAESRVGARGLMQLMEDTAAWIAHKLKEDGPSYTFDLLYDPEVNIRYGTWYLGYLSRRYDGDATKVICAYHAGQGNVDAWLRKIGMTR